MLIENAAKRYGVAFLDHLGITRLILDNKVDEVVDAYISTLDSVQSMTWYCGADGTGPQNKLKHFTFSDSSIFTMELQTEMDIHAFVKAVSGIFTSLLIKGFPSRGAIAFGNLSVIEEFNIVVGKPYIHAVTAESVFDSIGIVLVSPEEKHSDLVAVLNSRNCLSIYNVPLKEHAEEKLRKVDLNLNSLKMINWFKSPSVTIPELKEKLTDLRSQAPSGSPQRLYDNALRFLEEV